VFEKKHLKTSQFNLNLVNISTSTKDKTRLRAVKNLLAPHQVFADIDDDFWLWMNTDGLKESWLLQRLLPPLAEDKIQMKYNGKSGVGNLSHGFTIYQLVKSLAEEHFGKLEDLNGILDYGCGWGRILRFFLKDMAPEKLWGIDCSPNAINICKQNLPDLNISLIDPRPPSSLPSEHFDIIYSNSVFSHLNEEVHLQWINEFERVIKPGGLVVLTTWGERFIDRCYKARNGYLDGSMNEKRIKQLSNLFVGKRWSEKYNNGDFCYEPGNEWDFFGNTCIPKEYVQNNWSNN